MSYSTYSLWHRSVRVGCAGLLSIYHNVNWRVELVFHPGEFQSWEANHKSSNFSFSLHVHDAEHQEDSKKSHASYDQIFYCFNYTNVVLPLDTQSQYMVRVIFTCAMCIYCLWPCDTGIWQSHWEVFKNKIWLHSQWEHELKGIILQSFQSGALAQRSRNRKEDALDGRWRSQMLGVLVMKSCPSFVPTDAGRVWSFAHLFHNYAAKARAVFCNGPLTAALRNSGLKSGKSSFLEESQVLVTNYFAGGAPKQQCS